MPRIKPESPKSGMQPSVMVRSTDQSSGDEPTTPTAGLLAHEIPGVQMQQPGLETASSIAAQPPGGGMPRPGAEGTREARPAAAPSTMPQPASGQVSQPKAGAQTGVAMPRPGSASSGSPGPSATAAAPATGKMPQPALHQAQGTTAAQARGVSQSMPSPIISSGEVAPQAGAAGAGTAPTRQPHVFQKREAADFEAAIGSGAAAGPGIAGFAYPATLRGSTTHFNVYYDPSLGANGPTIADGVLASCEWEYSMLQSYFDGIVPPNLPFNIIVVSGLGGAFHYGCSATDLYCDGDTSNPPDINHTRMLVVAEEVEVFEAAQGRGWNCGTSNGEGLSRTLATQLYPAELDGFESASTWLNTPGRPDYITVTDPTDRNYVSTGCATLFLNFLRHQLRFSWEQITRAAAPTLAQTYTNLTGRTDAVTRFKSLLQAHYPEGTPVSLATDNVFPIPGVMEVFARGSDGAVWTQTQTAPNNGWSGWSSLGGWVDMIEVGQNDDLRLELFVRGADGAVWHKWQTSPNGPWSGWASMGGWIDLLELGQNADGRMEIFARGADGAVWHNWQTAPSNGWSGWASLGGWIDILALGKNADGRMELFARGSDGAVWHSWQTAPNNGWSGWASLGGWVDELAVGTNDDGRIEVFARGGDGALWHNWQTFPNNGWSGWASLGGWIDRVEVAHNADGRMEVFVRGSDGAVWHNWQTAPSNGWSGWASLGGWIDILEVFPEVPGQ